jgi:hypothetical protein
VAVGGDTVAGGFLDRIKKAMESGMFFGTISVKNSLNLLKGKEPGILLIFPGNIRNDLFQFRSVSCSNDS